MCANERLEGNTVYQNFNKVSLGRWIMSYFCLLLYSFLLLSFSAVIIIAFLIRNKIIVFKIIE